MTTIFGNAACPFCGSKNIALYLVERGSGNWVCHRCGKSFDEPKRPRKRRKKIGLYEDKEPPK